METLLLDDQQHRIGILICGHGSRNRLAVDEFAELVKDLESRLPENPVEYGYLEFAQPTLTKALERLEKRAANRILAIPAMLFAAGHTKNDIPSVLNNYSSKKSLTIDFGRELGIDRQMIAAAGARIKETLNNSSDLLPSETLLVVVGRGSSDPDANSNVAKLTRMLVEAFGFGWGETLYSGVTFPLVEPGLSHLVKLGFKRIVILPYFLFSGVLVSRIRQHALRVAQRNPQIEFLFSSHLGNHPLVVNTFLDRIREVVHGNVSMNCALCIYRDQILGFEADVGLVQESHHHHVEGLTESCNLCEKECTGACEPNGALIPLKSKDHSHSHSHNHHEYPHSDHPLGPKTLRELSDT